MRKTCKAEAKINYVKQAYAKLHLAVAYIAPFFSSSLPPKYYSKGHTLMYPSSWPLWFSTGRSGACILPSMSFGEGSIHQPSPRAAPTRVGAQHRPRSGPGPHTMISIDRGLKASHYLDDEKATCASAHMSSLSISESKPNVPESGSHREARM